MKPQIFVSVASYRDIYLPFTLDSAISNAVHPDRLVFGICWQADDKENLDRFIGDPRFRIRKYPFAASLGYGWARADVQKLYGGERYHLLIDSHSAFAPGWDENLIAQLESKPGKKPLLTTSSPPFSFDGAGNVIYPFKGTDEDGVPLMRCEVIRPEGWLDIQMSLERKTKPHQTTAFTCCNFLFTHGTWIEEVPEDPAMINAGHEGPLSVRSFTHGYDMYLPDEVQVWHLDYSNYPNGYRHKVWEAKSGRWQNERGALMISRLQTLVFGRGDPRTLGRYGAGKMRSVAEWGEAAGLNLTL
ncbi:MAG TPA: GlcNAc-transferase family protein [Polyangia bacterium]